MLGEESYLNIINTPACIVPVHIPYSTMVSGGCVMPVTWSAGHLYVSPPVAPHRWVQIPVEAGSLPMSAAHLYVASGPRACCYLVITWLAKKVCCFPLWECLGEGGGSLTDRTDGYGIIVRWYEIIRTVVNVSGICYYICQSTYQKHMSIMFWRTTKFDIGILTLKYLLLVCLYVCLKKCIPAYPKSMGNHHLTYWMAMSPCRPMSV